MAVKCAGRGKLTQLVTHHILGYKNRHELATVVNGERMTYELGWNRRSPRPGPDDLLLARFLHLVDREEELGVDERALLQ